MYTIAVLTVCVSLVLILGVLAFLASLILALMRAGVKVIADACGNLVIKAARFAGYSTAQHDYHTWHTATR